MTDFDKLDQVRELARARAQEDFEYLCNNVLGLSLPSELCDRVQGERVFVGFELSAGLRHRVHSAQAAWFYLQGVGERPSNTPETFDWLFGAERRQMERAA